MALQLASYPDLTQQLVNTAMPRTLRCGDHALVPPHGPAPRRLQLAANTAANDVSRQTSIAELVNRWIDQNPPQLYRGGA
jgi:hypothetical protein